MHSSMYGRREGHIETFGFAQGKELEQGWEMCFAQTLLNTLSQFAREGLDLRMVSGDPKILRI